ncbi:hypothetical protein GGH12_005562 [Coemansia sp. RSA 1822]|nr:hypothetical protein LPJ76_005508 [Coemansia sp. RSA 638]KAJ2539128.1 hypothetical protein GGF49_005439 [Coemansia sp. RSA 1853]KAJ2559076.1 hypothetical protein GGH12_005562 [Coemansia sp. RSA 1822]
MQLLTLALSVASVYALPPTGVPTNERIIGGQAAAANTFPSVVSIEIRSPNGSGLCGGTLINDHTVVTAGHCMYNYDTQVPESPRAVQIGYGSNNLTQQTHVIAQEIHLHPQFDPINTDNDIALVIIDPIKEFNKSVRPAIIYNGELPQGSDLVAVGWGLTSAGGTNDDLPDQLQQTFIVVGERDACRKLVPDYESSDGPQICTQNSLKPGTDTCQGDSGTGVFVTTNGTTFLAGLTSFGASPEGDPTCALDNGLAIYTHVFYFHEFLDQFAGALQNGRRRPVKHKKHAGLEVRGRHKHKKHHKHHKHQKHQKKPDDDDSESDDAYVGDEPTYLSMPEHTEKPVYTSDSGYVSTPEHTEKPDYAAVPDYSQEPSYPQSPSYPQEPSYSQAPPDYSQVPEYSQEPDYTEQPGYDSY